MRATAPRLAAGLALPVLSLMLAACSGGGDDAAPAPSPPAPAPPAPAPADTTAPTVPQGLTATAQSATQIGLTWTASTDAGTGVSGYRVFRNAGTTAIATVTTPGYTDTNLVAATQYTYAVSAFDGATPPNESAPSGGASATTPSAPPAPPSGSGLDSRPANTTCLAGDAPTSAVSLAVQRAFPDLPNFTQPIAMLQAPNDSTRWYVVEKTGAVLVFDNTANVSTTREFINLSTLLSSDPDNPNDERGLLGMAFHPDYPADPRVYFFYTGTHAVLDQVDRVSEFRTLDDGDTASLGSELVLFNVADPQDNHNGGNIAFGPDGFLYIGIGDGGGSNDAHGTTGNGQRLTTLFGKMLRIDVSASTASQTYTVPAGNPFAANPRCNVNGEGGASCPEIYAYGLRNPWRWSFDRVSGELWLNDVGQGALEEVNRIVLGGNYGWRCFEGTTSFNSTCGSNPNPLPPVAQYDRTLGRSTTGGFVYRGSSIPNLAGRYVFGDFATGNLWHIARDTAPTLTLGAGLSTNLAIASFAQDTAGEIYLVHFGGTLHRLVAGSGSGGQVAAQLSATGCVDPGVPSQPAGGLIPYEPNAAFFSDGANKARWLALPDGQRMEVDGTSGQFGFPNGSVLLKNFLLGTQLVETRLLMRHNDGTWAGYSYEWNAQGTDATRVVGGKTVTVAGQTWDFPSESQCLFCHNEAGGRALGLEIGQLNRDFAYPTGRTANQLTTLNAIDTLTPALTQPASQLPVIPDPAGNAPLGERARAYLHANCSYCHRPGGPTPAQMDWRYTTALEDTNACDVVPTVGDLGIANARLIAPGDPARSVVLSRMDRTGANAMPPLGRHLIDTAGVELISDWISGLSSCN